MAHRTQTYYNWAVEVASRTKDVNFPLDKQNAQNILSGIDISGKSVDELLSKVSFPVQTPADLLHGISQTVSEQKGTPGDNWAVNVARASKDVNFPMSKEQAREKLRGINAYGRDLSEIVDKIKFPVETPADLMHQISINLR